MSRMLSSSFFLLPAVLLIACLAPFAGRAASTNVLPEFQAEFIDLPGPPVDSNGSKFLLVDQPLQLRVHWPVRQRLPGGTILEIQVVDDRGIPRKTQYVESGIRKSGSEAVCETIIRIPGLPSSRNVTIYVGAHPVKGAESGADMRVPVIHGYALMRLRGIAMRSGWYPREKNASGQVYVWCSGTGMCEFARPGHPVFISGRGYAPINCFGNNSWNFTLGMCGDIILQKQITSSEFSFRQVLDPDSIRSCPSESSQELDWIQVTLAGDRTLPPRCRMKNDTRRLAFQLYSIELADYIIRRGDMGGVDPDGYRQLKPRAVVLLPNPHRDAKLFVLGKRDSTDSAGNQILHLQLFGKEIYSEVITGTFFVASFLLKADQMGEESEIPLNIEVEPVTFTKDSNGKIQSPGVAVSEIVLLPKSVDSKKKEVYRAEEMR